jgi:hypothetical protein
VHLTKKVWERKCLPSQNTTHLVHTDRANEIKALYDVTITREFLGVCVIRATKVTSVLMSRSNG